MLFDKIRVPFNRSIQSFLIDLGYPHIYNKGIACEDLKFKDDEDNEYILIPLKADVTYFSDSKILERIEDIKSNDVYDMADGDPFIKFVLELPVKEYAIYIKN